MFYVIYSPEADMYVNDEGGFCSYEAAARFDTAEDAKDSLDIEDKWAPDKRLRVVGPCLEGETP